MSRLGTLIGRVQSVNGTVVTVRIQAGQSSLIMFDGETHRIGQIGSLVRIPLGYTQLYGFCSQVGAAAIPHSVVSQAGGEVDGRWMTVILFGEAIGSDFERGVSQYPTFDDEVHLATTDELKVIYEQKVDASLTFGHLAAARSIPATLDLSRLVSRHCAVVGSTGAGKSNLVTVLLEALVDQGYSSSRVLIVDPHGEYSGAVGENVNVFSVDPTGTQKQLAVPYWALSFEEFLSATLGEVQPSVEADVRAIVRRMRQEAAALIDPAPDPATVTADSPYPFSANRLWFELKNAETATYRDQGRTVEALVVAGNADALVANEYEIHGLGMQAPFLGYARNIGRQVDLMYNRLRDDRYAFLLSPGADYTPDGAGRTLRDLDDLLADWVGGEKPVTVLDLSGAGADVLTTVTGTVLRVLTDALYWAGELSVGSRRQPLLVVLEEAHLFVREGESTAAHRAVEQIAKEGRKHGIGLMLVSQRPTDLDSSALSQCGTFISMRLTNQADRSRIAAAMPDELAGLVSLLPALRTGEAIVTGEAVKVPTRVRVRVATRKPVGLDPDLVTGWRLETRPSPLLYDRAVRAWRRQQLAPAEEEG